MFSGFQRKRFFDQRKCCHYDDTNQVHNPQKCHFRVVPRRAPYIINRKLHWTSANMERRAPAKSERSTKEERKTLKIEPINKSNAKRIINNNWFENYGATVPFWVVFRVPGLKKRWKRAVKREKSRDATWQRLVDVWWLPQWLCCCLFELI